MLWSITAYNNLNNKYYFNIIDKNIELWNKFNEDLKNNSCEPSPTYDLRRRSEGFPFFRNGTSLPLYGLVSVPLGCPNVK